MSNSPPNLSVCVGENIVCIRIAGRANFHSSVDFKALVLALRQSGHARFVLDLEKCQLMDSTFLGVLAGLGLKFAEESNGSNPPTIELMCASSRISDLLENLGIAHLFKPFQGTPPAGEKLDVDVVNQNGAALDRKEITRTRLEA